VEDPRSFRTKRLTLAIFRRSHGCPPDPALYFTAGIPATDSVEDNDLFGDIQQAPEPASLLTVFGGLLMLLKQLRLRLKT